MNVPADKANQVWASQKTLWPVEISADRWTQNVAWVNNQTSGKSDADVPFDPSADQRPHTQSSSSTTKEKKR
ncbi:hypothetical protein ACETU7_21345 [Rhodococcus sp. 3Y1]